MSHMNIKYGRKNKPRKIMLKNLCMSIILYEKVTTTQAKAKGVKILLDKSINIAKNNNLENKRKLLSLFLNNKLVVKKLLEDLGPKFKDQNSGYAKIYKLGNRKGDNAPIATIILSKSKFIETKKVKQESISK